MTFVSSHSKRFPVLTWQWALDPTSNFKNYRDELSERMDVSEISCLCLPLLLLRVALPHPSARLSFPSSVSSSRIFISSTRAPKKCLFLSLSLMSGSPTATSTSRSGCGLHCLTLENVDALRPACQLHVHQTQPGLGRGCALITRKTLPPKMSCSASSRPHHCSQSLVWFVFDALTARTLSVVG